MHKMRVELWRWAMAELPPMSKDKVHWKGKAGEMAKCGGQYWDLEDDYLAEHLKQYFNYEPEIQPVWRQ